MSLKDVEDMTPRSADQSQEHLGGDRVLLRPRRAVAGRRPDQPAVAAHARAAAVGPGPGRLEPQAGRLRSPRRAHLALRPDLPDRDAGRHQHRSDLSPGDLRRRRRVRLPDHAVPQGQARQADRRRSSGCGPTRRARPTWPRPTRRSTNGKLKGDTIIARYHGDFMTGAGRPGPVHRHLAQADGRRLGRPDPVPRARRRQPRPDGLEHAAPGRAAAGHRAADRGHRAWSSDVAKNSRHGRPRQQARARSPTSTPTRIEIDNATSTRCASSSA